MSDSYLERTLGRALPDFEQRWREVRRTYPPDAPPSAGDFLDHLVAHVVQALGEGRVAEVTRLFLTVERLLIDADPVLASLVEDDLMRALVVECGAAGIAPALVVPHLGPRSRAAWERAQPDQRADRRLSEGDEPWEA